MGIKIPVGVAFDKGSEDRAIQEFTAQFNKLGESIARASKQKFAPIDRASLEDLRRLTSGFESLKKVSSDFNKRLRATGQDRASFLDVDWDKLYPDPNVRRRQRQKAFEYVTGGGRFTATPAAPAPPAPGGRPPAPPAPPAPPPSPRHGRNIVGAGLNAMGPVGSVANSALSSGMQAGIGAGLAGLAGGLAALAIGKLIGAVREKIGAAQQEFIGYDTLKRQLGDVNVSFGVLKDSLREASRGLDMTFDEGLRLGQQFARLANLSSDQYKTLAEEVGNAGGFARSFGLDPSQGNAFFAQMRLSRVTSNVEDSRRLGLLVGEGIAKSGAFAQVDQVLEAIAGFTAQQTRMGMNAANVSGYAGALTGFIASGQAGLDPASAAALLGRVNSSIAGGGSEAAQNFYYSALGTRLGLDPIQTAILREQGAFGTGAGTFGAGSMYSLFAEKFGLSTPGAAGSTATNLELIMDRLGKMYAGRPELMVNAMSNLFGVNNSQAMALATIDSKRLGGLAERLKKAGVNINDVNATGISRIAQIEASGLSDEEKTRQIKEVATQNQESTEGSRTRATINGVERAIQKMASELVDPLNDIRSGIMFMAGEKSGKSSREILEAVAQRESKDRADQINADYDARIKKVQTDGSILAARKRHQEAWEAFRRNGPHMTAEQREAERARLSELYQEANPGQALERERDEKLEGEKRRLDMSIKNIRSGVTSVGALAGNQQFLAELSKTDAMIGAPTGFSAAQIMQESQFNPNAVSRKGAMGLPQVMPETLASLEKRLGRKLDPSKWEDAVIIHRELMLENKRKFGNYRDAARAYNGGWDRGNWKNPETAGYLPAIEENMARFNQEPATPIPESRDSMLARESFRAIELRGTFNLNGPTGQPAAAPVHVATRVGGPAPAGTTQ